MIWHRKSPGFPGFQLVEKVFFEYFLGAAHPSFWAVQPWTTSAVRKVSAWERALPSPLPRFFEKNRVKLFILRTFLRNFNASADFYVSAKYHLPDFAHRFLCEMMKSGKTEKMFENPLPKDKIGRIIKIERTFILNILRTVIKNPPETPASANPAGS